MQLLEPAVTTRYELRTNPRTGQRVYVPVAVPVLEAVPQPIHPANYVFRGLAPPVTRHTVKKAGGGSGRPPKRQRRFI